jgi:hypothetical protein
VHRCPPNTEITAHEAKLMHWLPQRHVACQLLLAEVEQYDPLLLLEA